MKLWEKITDIYYFFDDIYRELRIRRRKEKARLARKKASLSAEEFAALQKQIRRRRQIHILLAGVVLATVFLLSGLLIRALVSGLARRPQPETETVRQEQTEELYPETDLTLGSTGCMLLHSPFIDSYPDAEGNYDFSSIFTYITPYYSKPDFMTCEFEGALGGPEYGYSGFPTFSSPDIIIENIRDSGVDLQMLATNHIYDAWSDGFQRTMEVYEEKGIAYTGIRREESNKNYYIAKVKGVPIGFIDYVYETTNMTGGPQKSLNAMIMEEWDAPLLNSFNYDDLDSFYVELENSIARMRADGARFIVANMHWGIEYQLQEAVYQDEMAQRLCDLGVDALIGGHPHCEQPIDVLRTADGSHSMFCIYSEGNALSNQRAYLMDEMPEGHTEDGAMVTLQLHQDTSGVVTIRDVDLLPTWVYRYAGENGSKYLILPLDHPENLEGLTGFEGIGAEAQASYERTMEELGPGLEKAKKSFAAAGATL